ncbi:FecR family protein [Pedobacter nutrimenti]|uniref:FecR family protein n=1 Tax=Pedobacter nutrimenti TaxID=1241337 RepID=UPI00292EE031|nr:FecR family protein [Pedobacter nutrimenti]
MNSRLASLYQRYIENTCTKEEREEFLSLVAENQENGDITSLMDDTWNKIKTDDLLFPKADHVLQSIISTPQKPVVKKISWYRYAAAAAVLFLIGATLFYYNSHHVILNSFQNSGLVKNTIKAGQNKATLTLANGKVINLDSTTNGEIAEQTGITITKTEKGQLVYNVTESAKKEKTASAKIAYNTITTPRGGQYQINLPDGSKIWLNASSSLKYPTLFSKNERKVELSGEAYFEVAKMTFKEAGHKNVRMPFIVVTSKQQVEVLGTHFNINSYEDEAITKTTLLEGAVRVSQVGSRKTVNLLPGLQSVLNNNNLSTRAVDTDEAVAWKNGYFQFNESDLGSIMRQLSRWYNIEIIFKDNKKADELFHFKASRNLELNEMVKIFELNGIKLKIERRTLIVEP